MRVLRRLSTPVKIQDYVNALPFNFCTDGDTCFSPRTVLKEGTAHCMEGALLAALALRVHGHPPLVVDLEAGRGDDAHVITVFRHRGRWGAISKTNHAVLRYRDPVYHSIRELVMSYFHEYSDDDGEKTLRSFTRPINLSRFDRQDWMTSPDDVWFVPEYLADAPHTPILRPGVSRLLRGIDDIEHEMGVIVEWKKPRIRHH